MSESGRGAEAERMKRIRDRAMTWGWRGASARIARWMVGTAVYHVGPYSSSQRKNIDTSKSRVHTTLPPAIIEARAPATRPWPWNNGMTLRHRSPAVSPSATLVFSAAAKMFRCVSGTSFGRAVVPDVESINATSSGPPNPSGAGRGRRSPSRVKSPAAPSGIVESSIMGRFERCAAVLAGELTPC